MEENTKAEETVTNETEQPVEETVESNLGENDKTIITITLRKDETVGVDIESQEAPNLVDLLGMLEVGKTDILTAVKDAQAEVNPQQAMIDEMNSPASFVLEEIDFKMDKAGYLKENGFKAGDTFDTVKYIAEGRNNAIKRIEEIGFEAWEKEVEELQAQMKEAAPEAFKEVEEKVSEMAESKETEVKTEVQSGIENPTEETPEPGAAPMSVVTDEDSENEPEDTSALAEEEVVVSEDETTAEVEGPVEESVVETEGPENPLAEEKVEE